MKQGVPGAPHPRRLSRARPHLTNNTVNLALRCRSCTVLVLLCCTATLRLTLSQVSPSLLPPNSCYCSRRDIY